MEPSPFDDMDDEEFPARPPRRAPSDPVEVLTPEQLDRIVKLPPHLRLVDPWRCAYDTAAKGGVIGGAMMGTAGIMQCRSRIADPTKARYCYEHAMELGVTPFTPTEAQDIVAAETTGNLQRLVPKAVRTLELIMDKPDAPEGVRLKASEMVLNRTGFRDGIDIHIDAQVEVVDPMSKLRERLGDLRDAQMQAAQRLQDEYTALEDVVDVEVVEDHSDPPGPSEAP